MADDPPHSHDRIGGEQALAFANTISWRGTDRETDHIGDAAGLRRWAEGAGLADLIAAGAEPDIATVHRLRAAIQTVAEAIAREDEPPAAALAAIGRLAGNGLREARLSGTPLRIAFGGRQALLDGIAWAFLELLRSPQSAKLRFCPADDCHWLFVDRTKNGSRRWCDMATCGDKAKKRRRILAER